VRLGLRLKSALLARFGATPPARNTLSHANKHRDAQFAEKLCWSVLAHLQHAKPDFAAAHRGKGLLRRFKVRIHAVDSTGIQLVANCRDWAKHRRRKAAAKMHLRLGLHSFLPSFAIVDTASHHDNKPAREVCADIAEGEIVVFDNAYVDFDHLSDLDARGVWWVTRAKDNMRYRAVKNLFCGHDGNHLQLVEYSRV
jgi:Transposase DDE domain